MINFEGKEKREAPINACLKEYGIKDLEEARQICLDAGIDVESIVKGIQPICFENAVWAYTLGTALAIKNNVTSADEALKANLKTYGRYAEAVKYIDPRKE